MAFGLPNTDAGSAGPFLSRIQYDSRVGFWKIVRRVQQSDGGWDDEETEPFKNPTFLMDFGSLEVGYIKFASPPSFLVVPYGKPLPQQPEELSADGNNRRAFQPGFRVKVASRKTFGDDEAYYFANSAKTVLNPMDELHQACLKAPEYAAGKVPAVAVTGTMVVTGGRDSKFYAPVFKVLGWYDRPEYFGERTVEIPGNKPPAQQQAEAAAWSAHQQSNSARADNPRHVGPPPGHPASLGPPMDDLNDEIPF